MTVESQTEPVLWKTLVALLIVFVVWNVISSVVSVVVGLVNELFSNQSELMINFWCQLVGGAAGIYAAKWACEKCLKPYSNHVVFMFVALCSIGGFAIQYFMIHVPLMSERTLDSVANFGASIAMAYYVFWRNIPLDA